jgi:L-2-hydroxyglutarate oxidase
MAAVERVAIIGAGIIGAATARRILFERPGSHVTIYEKEKRWGQHQTGHNSGVVHAGLYYKPGSMKAVLCQRGRSLMREFCVEKGIAYDTVGKVLVARDEEAVGRLSGIKRRAAENGVRDVSELDAVGLAEVEPAAIGLAGMHSPHTAITDYVAVTAAMLEDVEAAGGNVRYGDAVTAIRVTGDTVTVTSQGTTAQFDRLISCGGVQSDRLVRAARAQPDVSIVPFRGSYFHVKRPSEVHLNGLIYPVPDPKYPFLGVHVTRHVDGAVSVGPNAFLAFGREGYRGLGLSPRDLASMAAWPGFYPMAVRNVRTALREGALTASKRLFFREVKKVFSGIDNVDRLERTEPGIRAQAVDRGGRLLDDFSVQREGPLTFVMNAPSPAATASIAIAEHIVENYVDWAAKPA